MEKVIKRYKNEIEFEYTAGYDLMRSWYANSEPDTANWMIDNVKPYWTVLDLGAHIGQYSMLLSYLVPQGQVWSFEPCQATRFMFIKNIVHNRWRNACDFHNVHLVPLAVGDKTGDEIPETLWLTDGTQEYGKTEGVFNFITLDDFCIKHRKFPHLDFIKSDLDGWDYEMLLGARDVFKIYRPYLIMEMNYALAWRGHKLQDVEEFLEEVNYQHTAIDPCPGQWLCWPKENS